MPKKKKKEELAHLKKVFEDQATKSKLNKWAKENIKDKGDKK